VSEGEGRKDTGTGRLSGRAPDNRLVHFNGTALPEGVTEPLRPGDMVTVQVTRGAPHYLEADGAVVAVRRTRSGDAWERRTAEPRPTAGVGLGMPTIGVPAPLPDAPVCG
jgi:tRNA-2-methylthio-N6-dimethylallyladenosine synthase